MRHRHIAHLSLLNHHLGTGNEQKSKYAEVAHYSADFSIAYLGLVVSLRENMAEAAIFFYRWRNHQVKRRISINIK